MGEDHDGDGEYTGTKWLDMVIDNSQVFLVGSRINPNATRTINSSPSGQIMIHLIDESMAIRPAILVNSTWFIAPILSLVNRFVGPRLRRAQKAESESGILSTEWRDDNDNEQRCETSNDSTSSDAPDSEASTLKKGESVVKMPTVKASGTRRNF